jgi:excisionase family DNA binding protein
MIKDNQLTMEAVVVKKVYTTKEIAEQLGKDHSMIRRAVAHGWLIGEKKGQTTLITEANLKRWIDAECPVYPRKKTK